MKIRFNLPVTSTMNYDIITDHGPYSVRFMCGVRDPDAEPPLMEAMLVAISPHGILHLTEEHYPIEDLANVFEEGVELTDRHARDVARIVRALVRLGVATSM